ncbi:MAG: hypothetical protein K2N28_08670 [Muribaculaceae bacterium]|nr:hypothetical protein [Muribaculaceae bacterium]
MKKSLLFSAAALMAFGTMFAETWKAETVFNYGVTQDGVSTAMPDIDGGVKELGWWSSGQKTDPNLVCNQSNARFAVGHNGKFYTIDDKQNAIVAIDANGTTKYVDIPSRVDGKWNGTAINVDDAGNIIYNYCFTDAKKSITEWGMVDATTKQVYNVTMSDEAFDALKITTAAGKATRLDCIGHIIGDVRTKAYAFVTFLNSQTVALFTFTGDGTKPTSLTGKNVQDIIFLAATNGPGGNTTACASTSFEEFEKEGGVIPQNHRFYVPVGVVGPIQPGVAPGFEDGYIGKWYDIDGTETWYIGNLPMGNRGYAGLATFELRGKRYIVRNYVDATMAEVFNNWKQVMTFGIFDVENGECVASWQDSYYNNGNTGSGALSAEVVDDNTVNVYTFVSTSTAGETPATAPGCYGAMVKFTVTDDVEDPKHELQGAGTEADPYLIGTPDDLCAAHLYIPQGEVADYVYFKQTADIDMAEADYTKWQALNGWGGQYNGKFIYDGDNHLIKNFAPGADREPVDKVGGYYDGSIFGVLRGTVKNLGVIDADVMSDGNFDGAGIITDYSGQGGVAAEITNVFVTGKVAGNKRIGGIAATAGAASTYTEVYAVVELNADGCETGGILGKLSGQTLEIDGGYVAATITGTPKDQGLIAGGAGTLKVSDFIVIGEGAAFGGGEVAVSQYATLTDDAKAEIQDLATFDEGKMLNGMPTFDWVNLAGGADEPNIKGTGTAADPYLIATAADLCEAHNLIPQDVAGDPIYFKQTADIDMKNADYDKWQALNGWGGQYNGKFVYDGDCHVIRNFAPGADRAPVDKEGGYYDGSIFGVLRGTVKNLGVIDADTKSDGNFDGAGIITDYSGQGGVAAEITNVFVTGKVAGNKRIGGIAATAGAASTYTEVYAVVELNADGCETGGILGKLSGQTLTIDGGYVAATITGTPKDQGLIVGGAGTLIVDNFVTIGAGVAYPSTVTATIDDVVSPKFDSYTSQAQQCIQDMDSFTDGKELNGMPTFNWMTEDQISGVDNVVVDGADEAAPAVYYNLQGVRVENPANGLYIKKQGNKVSKVVIR